MLKNPDAEARESAAQAICVANFRGYATERDMEEVKRGDETCRAALATIAAGNLQFREVADKCRALLIPAFNDEANRVREAAARCFHKISDERLCSEAQLIDSFLNSLAFREHAHILLAALEKAVHRLPDVVLKIPEKAVKIHQKKNSGEAMESHWWTNEMANLVLRLYEQTPDPHVKTRCLDALDKMIEFDLGNTTTELAKLERA